MREAWTEPADDLFRRRVGTARGLGVKPDSTTPSALHSVEGRHDCFCASWRPFAYLEQPLGMMSLRWDISRGGRALRSTTIAGLAIAPKNTKAECDTGIQPVNARVTNPGNAASTDCYERGTNTALFTMQWHNAKRHWWAYHQWHRADLDLYIAAR